MRATLITRFKNVTPETRYHVARIDSEWLAIAVWGHDFNGVNLAAIVDAKSGKVKTMKRFTSAQAAKLPACAHK